MPDPSRTEARRVIAERYRLGPSIARGATAEVFAATDEILGRPVAVKLLHRHLAEDPALVERFHREAVAAARLAHPNVVETYDAGVDGDDAYIVMEVAPGRSLGQLLAAEGQLPPARAVRIASQIAAALEEAHQQGILHRDLKPSTILVGDDDRVKVADLGITSGQEPPSPTGTAVNPDDPTFVGSPTEGFVAGASVAYRAPEQVNGEPLDGRTDVYALGAVLYEMVCGKPPFTAGTDVAVALAHLTETPLGPRQVRAGVPRPLEAVIMRALEKSPDDRFPTAAELQSALLSIDVDPDDAVPLVVRDPTPPGGVAAAVRFRHTERSWLWPTVLIVVVAVTLGVVGVLFATTETAQRLFNRDTTQGSGEPADQEGPLDVERTALFDPPPEGDGIEHNEDLRLLIDGNADTVWHTHQYQGPPFGNLKPGVGFVLTLERAADLAEARITTPSRGWAVEVYVADRAHARLADWGDPDATETGIDSGTVTLDLDGASGSTVLVWISDPGPANQVQIGEVELRS